MKTNPLSPHSVITVQILIPALTDVQPIRERTVPGPSMIGWPQHTVGEDRKWLPSLLGRQNLRKDCMPSSNHSRGMKSSEGALLFHWNQHLCPSWTSTLQNSYPGCLQCKRSDWSAHQELVDGTDTGPKCLCSDEERCDSEMPHREHGREWTGAH
ncbi:uncharacterized protein LOC133539901 isoform X5 [Nerophis ophidion]|uniref:uncharacterized protein LOC133539901 isoform X5 n=1 Tax=Nerophis ophidion TaxID=159077 RepID=UPI002ADF3307|nr:uncharacterized protein LOC133539901 isoform X5 [Nerophis ophidion]